MPLTKAQVSLTQFFTDCKDFFKKISEKTKSLTKITAEHIKKHKRLPGKESVKNKKTLRNTKEK